MLTKAIMTVVMLLVLPLLTGAAVCSILKIKKGIAGCYLFGSITEWAFIQLISVPMILMRFSFTVIVIVVSVFLVLMSITGLYLIIRNYMKREKPDRKSIQKQDIFAFGLMVLGYIAVALAVLFLQTKSFDDSRFVVTAVDMVKTDRMFLTNPNTGLEISTFRGDMHRDAVSPWAVYIAYCSRTTGFFSTTMAHTVLPQFLMLCMVSAYWLIADTFFHEKTFARCAVVFVALLVNVYGGYTGYNTETFALTRIWQGKAVVACIGIPSFFLVAAWIIEQPDRWSHCILMYMLAFAMCLMSGMGIIICGIMAGATGIVCLLLKKKIIASLKIWITVMIPLAYYVVTKFKY